MDYNNKWDKEDVTLLSINNYVNRYTPQDIIPDAEAEKVAMVSRQVPQRHLYKGEENAIADDNRIDEQAGVEVEGAIDSYDVLEAKKPNDYIEALVERRAIDDSEGFNEFGQSDLAKKYSRSGITIGRGIDLGHQSTESLLKHGLPKEVVNTIPKEFFGAIGTNAVKYLANYEKKYGRRFVLSTDKTINRTLLNTLSDKFYVSGIKTSKRKYNKASGKKFIDLTPQRRTLLFSLEHQYGNKPQRENWKLWDDIIKGNWDDVQDNLKGQDWKNPNDKGVRRRLDINAALASNTYE